MLYIVIRLLLYITIRLLLYITIRLLLYIIIRHHRLLTSLHSSLQTIILLTYFLLHQLLIICTLIIVLPPLVTLPGHGDRHLHQHEQDDNLCVVAPELRTEVHLGSLLFHDCFASHSHQRSKPSQRTFPSC